MKKLLSVVLSLALCLSCIGGLTLTASAANPTLTVNMTEKTGPMRHGSGGFLYGLGSDGTPNANMLTPLKPGTAVQKAPDGLQHPTGDVLDTAETFIKAGGEQVQIYLQDIYALWSYEYTGMDDYLSRIREMVPKIADLRDSNPAFEGKLVYVPFNEPDGIWYGNVNNDTSVQNKFNENWKAAYELIRELDDKALIGGVSYASYQSNAMESWIKFCVENKCEPDYITWHELQTDKLSSFKSHLDHYRNLEKKYGMSEREIIINEYAPQDHCSVPGKLVNWIALFEENKVSGCLPYWHNAGNLDDIAADNNEPNGAWWLYKWYGDMSGETLKLTTSTSRDQLYGLASIDDNKKSANVLFGGIDGTADIILKNIDQTQSFNGAEAVDIKVEATYWTAFHGVAPEPTVVLQGTYPVENGSVTITVEDMEAYTGYNLTITAASDVSDTGVAYKGKWRRTYEAENGTLHGKAVPNDSPWTYAKSGGYRLSGIDSPNDGVDITVEVPQRGYYRADLVYGNGYGLNTADTAANNPQTVTLTRTIDAVEEKTLVLENTLRWQMAGMYTDYVYLEAGSHLFSFRATTDTPQGASLDCLSLTYEGMEIPVFDSVYEAELGDFNTLLDNAETTVTTENAIEGYSASGYITGLDEKSVVDGGGVRFTVVVPDNGLYNLTLRYNSETDTTANIYLDNTALTLTNKLTEALLPASKGFADTAVTAFLQKGINIIDIDTDAPAALDYMRVCAAEADKTISVEAEDGTLLGNTKVVENKYGNYVANIEGETDDALEIKVNAPEGGKYKMVVYHSNGELFGAHDYNAQIVDRYASFSVNGGEAQRVYFKNSYSSENWRTVALDVELNEGENTVKVYNDNWRILQCGTLKAGTSQHLPENIDFHTLVNYAPNLDKFEFTPALLSESTESQQRFKLTLAASKGGTAELSKNSAAMGETVTLTLSNDYAEGGFRVLANGKNVSGEIENGVLTYTVSGNTEFKVQFMTPENDDIYIENNSFGTGDLTGWITRNDPKVIENENGTHSAVIKKQDMIGARLEGLEKGYYTLKVTAHGTGTVVFFDEFELLEEDFSDECGAEWQNENGSKLLRICVLDDDAGIFAGTDSEDDEFIVDEFKIIDFAPVDDSLLYFVDCGDSDVTTLSDGDAFGVWNSKTEQFFDVDEVTGKEWGILDTYKENAAYSNLLTGADTWPYEYDTNDGRDKILSYRYAKDQNDRTGAGVTYKFELPDGEYTFEVGFYQPSAWSGSNRKSSLRVNDTVIASGILPKSDKTNPAIVKAKATVEGGYATLNLKLDSDGNGGPMMSYIKIAQAASEIQSSKIDTTGMVIENSATWNDSTGKINGGANAFDSNTNTFFDGVSGGYVQIDLGKETDIAKIGFFPRSSWASRMQNTVFYGSLDATTWTKLFTIPSVPTSGVESAVDSSCFLTDETTWRYIKYQNPYDYCNVAEIMLYEAVKADSFVNLSPDKFKITSLSDTLSYESTVDAWLIYADYTAEGELGSIKTVDLKAGSGEIEIEDGHDKLFIWEKNSLVPFVIFK